MSFKITDRRSGYVETIEFDESEDRYVFGRHENVQPLLDHLGDRNSDHTGGFSPSRNARLKASIPPSLYDSWLCEAMQQGIPLYERAERDAFLKRKLVEMDRLKVSARAQGRIGYGD